ncbi:putative Pol polyprotein [Portunus trituberculatus]|uniref:Putative Pol polyprotein n=1 Tax=Portunus trituberculatus TaxID=210409 RepID=A0A5B7FL65_PORTR|nr:putative Pol polyprotein [Portunus trituberculatus]
MSLVKECGLALTVSLVPSRENKADVLTDVPQRWLKMSAADVTKPPPVCAAAIETLLAQLVTEIHHSRGPPGVRRTLYFVRRVNSAVTKRQVRAVVAFCQIFQSIDPAPVKWNKGSFSVEGIWQWIGMDITHCRGRSYLTLIDCGPSRFTIWRPLRLQTSDNIIEQLEAVFWERGAQDEILTDNDTAFRSKLFTQFALRWNVNMYFRGAYSPSGNGVIERCHRTV